jgi:hypothetical protein
LGALLALVMTSNLGCVVAERPYYYGPYARYDYARPYYPYRYYWNRDHYRWHRDHDRWDRD